MAQSNWKKEIYMNVQDTMSPFNPLTPIELFFNKNYLNEHQNKNLKEQSHIFIKDFKKFKDDVNKFYCIWRG